MGTGQMMAALRAVTDVYKPTKELVGEDGTTDTAPCIIPHYVVELCRKALKKAEEEVKELEHHECADGEWERIYDAQGIYLCRVCPVCKEAKLSRYEPWVLNGYTQADVSEPIEAED